jgi:non-lysosomal glucosylceramidase
MIYQGLVADGLKVVESVRRRHDGERRNPWNEPECGHHYARAMSAWGPLLALSGFLYDRPAARVIAKPRLNAGNFTSFWSAGDGWGVFTTAVRDNWLRFTLSARAGELVCRTVVLHKLGSGAGATSAMAGKKKVAHEVRRSGNEIVVTFAEDVRVTEGDPLVLIV